MSVAHGKPQRLYEPAVRREHDRRFSVSIPFLPHLAADHATPRLADESIQGAERLHGLTVVPPWHYGSRFRIVATSLGECPPANSDPSYVP